MEDVQHYSLEEIEGLKLSLTEAINKAEDPKGLDQFKREWLGKEGIIKGLFKLLKEVPADVRPEKAAFLNELKERAESHLEKKEEEFKTLAQQRSLQQQFFDLTLPSRSPGVGEIHPITRVERTIARILRQCGFEEAEGPIVEKEYYCFDALNIPPHHPARDMQDTFYTEGDRVLRTHTTSVQARLLEKGDLPVRAMSYGPVYRNEAEDATHTSMFHQFELVWVEDGLTLSHLLGLISHILKELYGRRRKVRFVPKFYPYTEPSLGAQVECSVCKGKGCDACGGAGWATVAGAGMIHRNVLQEFKLDPEKVTGFAFGLGTGRLAAQICNYEDMRKVYDNDLRVLKRV